MIDRFFEYRVIYSDPQYNEKLQLRLYLGQRHATMA